MNSQKMNNKRMLQQQQHNIPAYSLLLLCCLICFTKLTVNAQSIASCGPNFPNSCMCGHEMYESLIQYIVNCTNAGLHNTSVLEFLPKEVQILIFTGNYIEELPWNVFGSINDYKNLTVVDMSNNHIRDIRGKAYHHVQNVQRLLLNNNNLSISRDEDMVNHHHPRVFSNFVNLQSLHLTNAFGDNSSAQLSEDLHDIFVHSELRKLQKLHLEQNEITHFKDRRVFCELPSLRDLHLGDNLLKEINFDVGCLNNLRFLDLERNKFEFVKMKDLMLLDKLEGFENRTTNLIVDFNLNPFKCDCDISSLYIWLKSTNVTVRNMNSLMCYRNKNEPVLIMDKNMQECASSVQAATTMFNLATAARFEIEEIGNPKISGHTATLIFLLIVLSMILVGLIVALVYVSRDKIKYMVTPVLDNVSKKVQYTSIKDEDCPEVHV